MTRIQIINKFIKNLGADENVVILIKDSYAFSVVQNILGTVSVETNLRTYFKWGHASISLSQTDKTRLQYLKVFSTG